MAITTKPKQFLLLLIQKFQTFFSLGLVFLLSILVLGYSLFSGFYQINTDLFPAKDALAAVNCPAQFTWNGTNCIQTVQKLPVCDRGGVLVSNNCVPDYQSAQGIKTANCRLGLNLSTSNACFQFNPDSGVVDRAVFGYPTVCGQYNVTQSDINLIYAGRSGLDFLTNNFSPSPIQYYLADHADGQYCLNPVTFNYPFLPTVNFQSCNFIPGQINIGTNSRISCENGNLVFQATNAGVGAGNTSIYSTMLLDSRPTASGTAKKLECLNVGFQAVNSCKLLEKTLNSATPKVPGTTVQLGNVKNLFIDKVGYDSNLTYQNTGGCPAGFSDTPGGGGLSCQKITAPIGQSVDSTDIDLATSSVCSPQNVTVNSQLSYCIFKLKPAVPGIPRFIPSSGIFAGLTNQIAASNTQSCVLNASDYLYCPTRVGQSQTVGNYPVALYFPGQNPVSYLQTNVFVNIVSSQILTDFNTVIPFSNPTKVTNCSENKKAIQNSEINCFFKLPDGTPGQKQLFSENFPAEIKAFIPNNSPIPGTNSLSSPCTIYNNYQPTYHWIMKKSGGNFDLDYGNYFDIAPVNYTGSIPDIVTGLTLENSSGGGGEIYSGWSIEFVGDFDLDGIPDYIWRNSNSGQIVLWGGDKNVGSFSNWREIGVITETSVRIVGMGDWDKDGDQDLYFQDTTNNLIGALIVQAGSIISSKNIKYQNQNLGQSSPIQLTSGADKYRIQGVKDFNGDGFPDIVFRNKGAGGNIVIWNLDQNLNATVGQNISQNEPDLTKDIAGISDLNGDGKMDLLWKKYTPTTTPDISVWYLNGTSFTSAENISTSLGGDFNWRIVGLADINGDNIDDIIWRNYGENSSIISCTKIPVLNSPIGTSVIKLFSGDQVSGNVVGKVAIISPYIDTFDFDFDGISNKAECVSGIVSNIDANCTDSDNDGIPNWQDSDSDNDGIPDTLENKDTGQEIYISPATDTDNDNIPDYLDLDSDSDGLLDKDEKGLGCVNLDNCAVSINVRLKFGSENSSSNSNSSYSPNSSRSSSNSSIFSNSLTNSSNSSSRSNQSVSLNSSSQKSSISSSTTNLSSNSSSSSSSSFSFSIPITPASSNNSQNNSQNINSFSQTSKIPIYLDTDQDTIPDDFEKPVSCFSDNIIKNCDQDPDKDNIPNYLDLDSDGDGIPDETEVGGKSFLNINGQATKLKDTDGDGTPDFLDSDSNNDGIPDNVQKGNACPSLANCNLVDSDKNGVSDYLEFQSVSTSSFSAVNGNIVGNVNFPSQKTLDEIKMASLARTGSSSIFQLSSITMTFSALSLLFKISKKNTLQRES